MTRSEHSVAVGFRRRDQRDRFYELKERVRSRMGVDYLRNDVFAELLMDVYEHHEEAEPGPLLREYERTPTHALDDSPRQETAVLVSDD